MVNGFRLKIGLSFSNRIRNKHQDPPAYSKTFIVLGFYYVNWPFFICRIKGVRSRKINFLENFYSTKHSLFFISSFFDVNVEAKKGYNFTNMLRNLPKTEMLYLELCFSHLLKH